MTTVYHRPRNTCIPVCILAAALLVGPVGFSPSVVQAVNINVYGGGGGGGGGGGDYGFGKWGGKTYPQVQGGWGANGTTTDGGGGGGGSGGFVGASNPQASNNCNGGDASGTTGGTAGTGYGSGADSGTQGTDAASTAGGNGGVGGNASFTSTETSVGAIHVNGGTGGTGGTNNGGTGGNGGAASLSLSAASVRADSVFIESGSTGTSDGGAASGLGGSATFTAYTLTTNLLQLTKNDANLAFSLGTLDVSGSTRTVIMLDNTTAVSSAPSAGTDGVYIGMAQLGDGTLTVNKLYNSAGGNALIDTLELTGSGIFNDTDNPVTLGSLTLNGGTLNNANWSGIVDHAYTTSDITLGANGGTFALEAGEDKALSRNLVGAGALTKTGAGVLTLSGTNTYSGGTTIGAGTLRLTNAAATGTGVVTVGASSRMRAAPADATLELAFTGTYTNSISGSGGLTTDPGVGSTVTLSGVNTYTGMTTVQSGTLTLGSDLASKQLTLNGGTTFDRGSHNHSLDNGVLNVNGSNGQSATYTGDLSAQNATLNFISPVNPTQPLLTVSGDANISGSAYNVGLSGGTQLAAGSQLTLLEVGAGKTLTANNLTKGNGIIRIGSTVAHDITASTKVDPASGKLVVDVSQGQATEQAKALSEGFLGGVGLAVQGADLAAGQGTLAAVNAARNAGGANWGFAGFGALSGASTRYNTGSHIDMHSLSLLTGLAFGADTAPGRLTVGAFFEYGNGSYNTYNSFSNAADVDGDGNTHYLGGGLLARMDFIPTGPGNFYAEASGRAGSLHNKYENSDLRDASGRTADYESNTPYYGLHFGAGYVWNFNDKASLDLYGKYFWTRVQGDSLTLSTGEQLKFEDVDSNRLRFGGRFAYTVNEYIAPYIGAAWEHEFSGKARATTNGFDIDAPSLRGDTGIGEIGLSLTPSVDLPLTVDLGVQGYTGKREGVSGSLQVKWEF